jgi:hypothetical protein
MARETVTELVDDLDGSKSKGVETVEIWDPVTGTPMEVELHAAHRRELEAGIKTLRKFFDVARIVAKPTVNGRGPGRRRGSSSKADSKGFNAELREWAAKKGIEVAARGRIAHAIIDQFNAERGGRGTVAASQAPAKAVSAPVKASPKGRQYVTAKKALKAGLDLVPESQMRAQVLRNAKKFAEEIGTPIGQLSVNEITKALADAVDTRDDIAFRAALDEISGKRPSFSG